MEHKLLEKVLKIFLLLSTYVIVLYAGTQELHKPTSKTYDFTYNSLNKKSESYKTPKIVPKITYSVDSELSLIPRHFKVESCPSDKFGNIFCPEALSKAEDTWSYNDGMLYERKESVIDYELGRYQEHKDIVRDFMDGTATTHTNEVTDSLTGRSEVNVGTVTDYQSNSTSIAHSSTVMDFADKVGSSTSVPMEWKLVYNQSYQKFYRSMTLLAGGIRFKRWGVHVDTITFTFNGRVHYLKQNQTKIVGTKKIELGDRFIGSSRYSIFYYFKIYEKSCPSGYIKNSDLTICLKLEDTEKEIYDSGWIRGSNPWNSWSQECRDSCSAQRVEGMTVSSNPFNANGYTYTRGSVIFRGSSWTDGFHTLWAYKKTKTTEKCKQYGVMVSVGGKNYCTYEYSYEEPILKKQNSPFKFLVNGPYIGLGTDRVYASLVTEHSMTGKHLFFYWNREEYYVKLGNTWVTSGVYSVGGHKFTIGYIKVREIDKNGGRAFFYSISKEESSLGCKQDGELVTIDGKQMCRYAGESAKCPDFYTDNGTTCQKEITYNFYEYKCPTNYTPVNSGFATFVKNDPDPKAVNENTLDDDVNSATAPAENCKRVIPYNYYNYNCPVGYTVNSGGMGSCDKTDPDRTSDNSSLLSQACNDSTPPEGNCTKQIAYNYYEYGCATGYTAIDKGLTACDKTDSDNTSDSSSNLDDDCNNPTPPPENCYKDIEYKYYSYGCSEGYKTDNYGLNECKKVDPDKSTNNSETLDDNCNSKTPPEGNCRKSIEYSFYEYQCENKNSFDEPYEVQNEGLKTCVKTDTDKNAVNQDTLDDNCNEPTLPTNNCKSKIYTCNSNKVVPAFVDGEWQCSALPCNVNNQCGTARCIEHEPSTQYFMPTGMKPVIPKYSGSCTSTVCDAVSNSTISYCESEGCPDEVGIYEKNGGCYYDDCPLGSKLNNNGDCEVVEL